ncbi:MAG: hypothetical protein FJY98_03190 [Candidatus Liptonbacteria bacterium]|nr:hypothetical protein [Candidatus Liptonbacteria bacterium]
MSGGHGGGGGAKGVIAILAFLIFLVAAGLAVMFFPKPTLNPPAEFDPFKPATSTNSGLRVAGPRRAATSSPASVPIKPSTSTQSKPSTKTNPNTNFTPNYSNNPGETVLVPMVPVSPSSGSNTNGGSEEPLNLPVGITKAQVSPYYGKVRVSSISPGGFGYAGQASLSANFDGTSAINVSNWRIQGNRGSHYIPKAVRVYEPNGLTPETDIAMRNGDYLYLYSGGTSAIGKNLRLNKCLGYLPNIDEFDPAVPKDCPYVERSEISKFTGQCQEYITTLGACGIPDLNDVRVPQTDYACRSYLENLNYRGCVDRYRGDADFLRNEVRAWIGTNFLDSLHDKVYLYDRQGLFVDYYEY